MSKTQQLIDSLPARIAVLYDPGYEPGSPDEPVSPRHYVKALAPGEAPPPGYEVFTRTQLLAMGRKFAAHIAHRLQADEKEVSQ